MVVAIALATECDVLPGDDEYATLEVIDADGTQRARRLTSVFQASGAELFQPSGCLSWAFDSSDVFFTDPRGVFAVDITTRRIRSLSRRFVSMQHGPLVGRHSARLLA